MANNGKHQNGNGGRSTRYDPDRSPVIARVMCRLGATAEEISEALGVCPRTVETCCHRPPVFLQAPKEGRTVADARVEDRLHRRATGYTLVEERVISEIRENPGLFHQALPGFSDLAIAGDTRDGHQRVLRSDAPEHERSLRLGDHMEVVTAQPAPEMR